jgi:hypothetical protein
VIKYSDAVARLDEFILLAFVSAECITPEGGPERTTLPSVITPRDYGRLVPWFVLEEDTFVQRAERTVKEVHEITLESEDDGPLLMQRLTPLQEAGLSEDEILDTLTRSYYRALRNIMALQNLAARK